MLPFDTRGDSTLGVVTDEVFTGFVEDEKVEADDGAEYPDMDGRGVDTHHVLEERRVHEGDQQQNLEIGESWSEKESQ